MIHNVHALRILFELKKKPMEYIFGYFYIVIWNLNSYFYIPKESESDVAQLCLTLCDPMACSLPASSVHGIFQARILECVAISFSRRSSQPRDWTRVPHIVGRRFTIWATGKSKWRHFQNFQIYSLFIEYVILVISRLLKVF